MSDGRITADALAAELGVSYQTVRNDAMLCGIADHRGPYTPAQADAIRATRRGRLERATQQGLADELRVSRAAIRWRARRLGLRAAPGYTPEQAEALRRSFAATPSRARRRDQG